jgi:hypothetical protein
VSATFVDIDCGREELDCSAEEAAEVLDDLVQRGRLAQPSMIQFSGRGLWAFWLLRDEEDPSTFHCISFDIAPFELVCPW